MTELGQLNLIAVDEFTDPRLVKFSYRRESQLRPHNEMMIDSEKVVYRAMQNGIHIKQILATEKHYRKHFDMFAQLPPSTVKYIASQKMMEEIVGHRIHQGMMALADRPAFAPLEELGSKILCVNKSTDSSNVGAMMRNAHALNYDSVIFDDDACHPYVRRAVRVSMGSVFNLKIHQSQSLPETLGYLKQQGYQIISAGLWRDAVSLSRAEFREKNVVIIGNEDKGVEDKILKISDLKVKIDLAPTVDSLNAACASAILLYETGKKFCP